MQLTKAQSLSKDSHMMERVQTPFFLAGKSGKPSSRGEYVLPWPANGQVYGYNDEIPLLPNRLFDGSEDLTLILPPGASTSDIKWLSVWCRDFNVNFGHVNVV